MLAQINGRAVYFQEVCMASLVNRYSYSGSDAKVFAYFDKKNHRKIVPLESMHTISFSIYEAKGRVRSLGFKSIRGFTRAVREISGTMIMTIIEDHPLAKLMAVNPYQDSILYGSETRSSWSIDATNTALGARKSVGPTGDYFQEEDIGRRAPTTLPPFNIMVQYNTEVPSKVTNRTVAHTTRTRMKKAEKGDVWGLDDAKLDSTLPQALYSETTTTAKYTDYMDGIAVVELIDVELMGQGIVTSVNDMVTEVQYQFVARDYREFQLDHDALDLTTLNDLEIVHRNAIGLDWEQLLRNAISNEFNLNVKSFEEYKRRLENGEPIEVTSSVGGTTEASKNALEVPIYSEINGWADYGWGAQGQKEGIQKVSNFIPTTSAEDAKSVNLETGKQPTEKKNKKQPINTKNFFIKPGDGSQDDGFEDYKNLNPQGEYSPTSIGSQLAMMKRFPNTNGLKVVKGRKADYIVYTVNGVGTVYTYPKGGGLKNYSNGHVFGNRIPSGAASKNNGHVYRINRGIGDNSPVYTYNSVKDIWEFNRREKFI